MESRGLVQGDGRVSRDKQMDEKACIKGRARRTQIPRAASCHATWRWTLQLSTSVSAPRVQSSNPNTARAQTSMRKQSRGWGAWRWLVDPGHHHAESVASEAGQAGHS